MTGRLTTFAREFMSGSLRPISGTPERCSIGWHGMAGSRRREVGLDVAGA
jgi:hypothetical protein